MGLLQYKSNNDVIKSRCIWALALRRWNEQTEEVKKETPHLLGRIAVNLARLEESEGNLREAVSYYELAMKVTPNPEVLQKSVNEIKARLREASSAPLKPAQ